MTSSFLLAFRIETRSPMCASPSTHRASGCDSSCPTCARPSVTDELPHGTDLGGLLAAQGAGIHREHGSSVAAVMPEASQGQAGLRVAKLRERGANARMSCGAARRSRREGLALPSFATCPSAQLRFGGDAGQLLMSVS